MFYKNKVLKKATWISLIVMCIGALLLVVHTRLHQIKIKKKPVVAALSQMLGRPVSAETVQLDWNGLDPIINLTSIKLLSNEDHNKKTPMADLVGQATIELSWWNSLLHWRWMPARVTLKGVHLVVKKISPKKFNIMQVGFWRPDLFSHDKVHGMIMFLVGISN